MRVIALLGPERKLAAFLAAVNIFLAGILLLEPWLFGRVIDALVAQSHRMVWRFIAYWAGYGIFGIVASVWVSLHADRLAHRRRLAVITAFFEHALGLPLAFHGEHHTGRMLRVMHSGGTGLFFIWLGFLRDHLATLLSIIVVLPLALFINWKLGLLMIALMSSFVLFNGYAMRRTDKAQRQIEHLHQEIAERTSDVLSNAQVIQCFTGHDAEVTGFATSHCEYWLRSILCWALGPGSPWRREPRAR